MSVPYACKLRRHNEADDVIVAYTLDAINKLLNIRPVANFTTDALKCAKTVQIVSTKRKNPTS